MPAHDEDPGNKHVWKAGLSNEVECQAVSGRVEDSQHTPYISQVIKLRRSSEAWHKPQVLTYMKLALLEVGTASDINEARSVLGKRIESRNAEQL